MYSLRVIDLIYFYVGSFEDSVQPAECIYLDVVVPKEPWCVCVCVLQKAADTQASPDGRCLGVSLHWTLALAAHWALTSTLNISQVSEQRYTPCTHTLSEIHFLTKKKN